MRPIQAIALAIAGLVIAALVYTSLTQNAPYAGASKVWKEQHQ